MYYLKFEISNYILTDDEYNRTEDTRFCRTKYQ